VCYNHSKKESAVDIKTLTGLTLEEVAKELNKNLGEGAYRPVNVSGLNLTDISPAYRDEVFNKVFGMCGYGWGYDYDPGDVQTEVATNKNGKTVYAAHIAKINMWYRLIVDGETITCDVPSTGHNTSYTNMEYALKGAITSALGKSASHLGWQSNIYKGEGVTQEAPAATAAPAERDFLSSASMLANTQGLIDAAKTSPLAQRLVLSALNGESLIKDSIRNDVGDEAADAISKSFARLGQEAGVSLKDFVPELTGKPFEKISYGEAAVLWDSLAQIAGGADKDNIVRAYKFVAGKGE
jgi:hypothetical protein